MSEEETTTTEETEVKAEATEEAPQPNTDIEGRARRMGWRPKEEFRGPDTKWVDADQFVERGESELPVLRERFRALDDRFSRQEQKLVGSEKKLTTAETKIDNLTQVLTEFRDYARQGEERAYNRAKRDLEAQMRTATAMADTAQYDAAKAELDNLERAKPAPKPADAPKPEPQASTPEVAPEVQDWVRGNEWFERDPTLRAYATALHGELLKEKPGLSLKDNLEEVTDNVKKTFASKFGITPKPATPTNPNREKAAAVSTSSTPGSSGNAKKGKGYSDLPPDAKAACDKFVREIPKFTKEEYVKTFFAGEDD